MWRCSLALVERNDLCFNECIVTDAYRSANDHVGSTEFERFLIDFEKLYTKIKHVFTLQTGGLMVIQ